MGEPANSETSFSFGTLAEGSAFGTPSWGALTMGSSTPGQGGTAKNSEASLPGMDKPRACLPVWPRAHLREVY